MLRRIDPMVRLLALAIGLALVLPVHGAARELAQRCETAAKVPVALVLHQLRQLQRQKIPILWPKWISLIS